METKLIKNIGEITGEIIKISEIDQGMPLRGNYDFKNKREMNDNYNRHIDFEVYEDSNINMDISYFDPDGDKMFDFNNITDVNPINKADPIEIVNYVINDNNWYMFSNMINVSKMNILSTSVGTINLMSVMYISSSNDTEQLLSSFFNLPDKNTLLEGLNELNTYINQSECCKIDNIILTRMNINQEIVKYFNNIVKIIQITDNPMNNIARINNILNNKYSGILGNIIKPKHISNLGVLCLTTGSISTIWKIPFSNIIKMNFGKNTIEYMYNKGETYDYYEDNTLKLIELPMYDDIITMGLLLPKKNNTILDINLKEIDNYISNLQSTNIMKIAIPKFNEHYKLKTSSIFKNFGLGEIFNNLYLPELLGENSMLNDIIHNIYINVDNNYTKYSRNHMTTGITSNIQFIANRPFIYYFRCVKTNTIILTASILSIK